MGIRDELITEIAEQTGTEHAMRNDGAYGRRQAQELSVKQARTIEKQLTGETDYSDSKGEVMINICEAIDHDERKDLRSTKNLSVDGLKKVRDSLQQA